MKSLKKLTAACAMAALSLAALGACSAADQAASSKAQGGEGSDGGKGSVTVITHDSFALSDEAKAEFEKTSGYKLVLNQPGDAGQMLAALKLTPEKPGADAFFGIDNYSIADLAASGALGSSKADEVWGDDGEAATLIDPLFEGDGGVSAVPVDRADVCLNVDNAWFETNGVPAPASFDDLVKPEYKSLTVITNPASSSPGYALLTGTHALYGDGVADWWRQLFANGVKVAGDWTEAYYTDFTAGAEDGTGTRPIVLSYASSPAETAGGTSAPQATCVPQIEYVGVLKGAENPEGAQAFVNFMLSKMEQAEMPEQMYVYPQRDGVALPEAWAQYVQIPRQPIQVDAAAAGANREQWITDWTSWFEAAQS